MTNDWTIGWGQALAATEAAGFGAFCGGPVCIRPEWCLRPERADTPAGLSGGVAGWMSCAAYTRGFCTAAPRPR